MKKIVLDQKKTSPKEERWNKFDINQTLSKFVIDEPFYSQISSVTNKIKSDKINTAGVCVGDGGEYILYYNEEYFNSLNWRHKQGLLIHEFLHLIFHHTTSRFKFKENKELEKLWFFACDFAVNSLIEEVRLPHGALIPGVWPDMPENIVKTLSKKYGSLEFNELFKPAIKYAQNGFLISPITAQVWKMLSKMYNKKTFPEFHNCFMPNGRAPYPGEVFKSPEQAKSKLAGDQDYYYHYSDSYWPASR